MEKGSSPSFRRRPESSDLKDGIGCPYNYGLISIYGVPRIAFRGGRFLVTILLFKKEELYFNGAVGETLWLV